MDKGCPDCGGQVLLQQTTATRRPAQQEIVELHYTCLDPMCAGEWTVSKRLLDAH